MSTQFLDDLTTKFETGGEEAAQLLGSSITNYLKDELPDFPVDLDVVVRVYGNLRGLSRTLVDNGILDQHEDLGRFICGFNKKFALFDFIDAGNGKECSDAKLKSMSIAASYDTPGLLTTSASQKSSSLMSATLIVSTSYLADRPITDMLAC